MFEGARCHNTMSSAVNPRVGGGGGGASASDPRVQAAPGGEAAGVYYVQVSSHSRQSETQFCFIFTRVVHFETHSRPSPHQS